MTSDITLYDNGNGTYTFSLEAPISDMNAKRKFVFVVNDDAAVAATAAGSAEADLHETAATVELSPTAIRPTSSPKPMRASPCRARRPQTGRTR